MAISLNRVIWLLWFQGWHSCPRLVKDVRTSWYFHNSADGWRIVELDSLTIGKYVGLSDCERGLNLAAQSDLVRLRLLSRYGGVWADATMLCMRPLDDWIEDALPSTGCGFWMYHGRDRARGPASWFMVSKKGSYLADTWSHAATDYWEQSRVDNEYFWMDRLFAQIIKRDSRFMQDWQSVPFLDCEAPFQAHCLAGRVFESFDCSFRDKLLATTAPALKLSHQNSEERYSPFSNAFMAFQLSINPLRMPPPVEWGSPPSFRGANYFVSDEEGSLAFCVSLSLISKILRKIKIFTLPLASLFRKKHE